jgi:hypothetical protein
LYFNSFRITRKQEAKQVPTFDFCAGVKTAVSPQIMSLCFMATQACTKPLREGHCLAKA